MWRRQIVLAIAILVATAVFLAALATPADAREIRLVGCDSLLNWPCPGPAL